MVQIFISHDAICFQAPYQVQHIHYKTTIHLTTTASYAYSHLIAAERYCSLKAAQTKYGIQKTHILKNDPSDFTFHNTHEIYNTVKEHIQTRKETTSKVKQLMKKW